MSDGDEGGIRRRLTYSNVVSTLANADGLVAFRTPYLLSPSS